jgi:vitamin B12 transporter
MCRVGGTVYALTGPNPRLWVFILMIFVVPVSNAQRAMPDDSLLYWMRDGVVVTGTRMLHETSRVTTAGESISGNELSAIAAVSIGDVLKQTAGSAVIEYGSRGSLQLASYRGMGAEYTAVYLNGIRLNSAQNGLADLARLQVASTESIDVARGGYSSLYGADAIGGVVNIRTSKTASPFSISAGGGSFGWRMMSFASGFSGSAGNVRVAGVYEAARNDYPISMQHEVLTPGTLRENADFVYRAVEARGDMHFAVSKTAMYARFSAGDVGVPGAIVSINQGKARQSDRELVATLSWLRAFGSRGLLDITGSAMFSGQSYSDPLLVVNGAALASDFRNFSADVTARGQLHVTPSLLASAGFEAGYAQLRSDDVSGMPQRHTLSAWVSGDAGLGSPADALHMYPALRVDALRELPSDRLILLVAPSLGLNMPLVAERLAIHGRIAHGEKLPTFNQMYWIPGGNPDLRPESALTAELGLGAASPEHGVRVDVTGHWADLIDRIIWMPQTSSYWAPRNIQHVVSRGVETSVRVDLPETGVGLRFNAQYLSAVKANSSFPGDATEGKQIPYTPWVSAAATLTWHASGGVDVSITPRFTGRRYGDETNSVAARLEPFFVADMAGSFGSDWAGMRWRVKAECLNVFDAVYESIALYPMPGRWFRATIFSELITQ